MPRVLLKAFRRYICDRATGRLPLRRSLLIDGFADPMLYSRRQVEAICFSPWGAAERDVVADKVNGSETNPEGMASLPSLPASKGGVEVYRPRSTDQRPYPGP